MNTYGLHKKSSQAYDDIILADNGPAPPDMISGVASIIIAPSSEDCRGKQHPPLLCIHITAGSLIGAQSVCPIVLLMIVAALQLVAHIKRTSIERDCPRFPGILPDS